MGVGSCWFEASLWVWVSVLVWVWLSVWVWLWVWVCGRGREGCRCEGGARDGWG